MIRCAIVDDEPAARSLLRTFLADVPGFEIVAEYCDGREALDGIRERRPDLVFLDLQMPELDGFEVVAALEPEEVPDIVFVTAYDEHALRAFEVNAVDYIVKPFDRERLSLALNRARTRHASRGDGSERQRMITIIDELRHQARRYERLIIRMGERTLLQRVSEIDWIEADSKHVRIHVGPRTLVMREALSRVEARLDPTLFIRVSRSAIVNIGRIAEIQSWFKGELMLVMSNGAQVPTTKNYREGVVRLLDLEAETDQSWSS